MPPSQKGGGSDSTAGVVIRVYDYLLSQLVAPSIGASAVAMTLAVGPRDPPKYGVEPGFSFA